MTARSARAVAVADDLLRSRRFELLFADSELLRGALVDMKRFAHKRFSLADCAGFQAIESLGLDGAFTFDRDFRDGGYRTVP